LKKVSTLAADWTDSNNTRMAGGLGAFVPPKHDGGKGRRYLPTPLLLSAMLLLVGGIALAGLAGLNLLRFQQFATGLVGERLLIQAEDARDTLMRGLDLGLRLEAWEDVPRLLDRMRAEGEGIERITLYLVAGQTARVLHTDGPPGPPPTFDPGWLTLPAGTPVRTVSDGQEVALPLINAFGQPVGVLHLRMDPAVLGLAVERMGVAASQRALLVGLAAAPLGLLALLLALGPYRRRFALLRTDGSGPATAPAGAVESALDALLTSRDDPSRGAAVQAGLSRLQSSLAFATMLVVLLAGIGLSVLLAMQQRHQLTDLSLAKAGQLGAILARDVARALDLGIPIDRLVGVDQTFQEVMARNTVLRFIVLTDSDGAIRFATGTAVPEAAVLAGGASGSTDTILVSAPVRPAGGEGGSIRIGVARTSLSALLLESLFETAALLLVIAILAVEALRWLIQGRVMLPLYHLQQWRRGQGPLPLGRRRNRETDLFLRAMGNPDEPPAAGRAEVSGVEAVRVARACTFLFMLADALPLAFLPLHVAELGRQVPFLGPALAISLPVAVYWLVAAVGQIPGVRLLRRYSYRTVFGIGAVLAALGHVWTGLAPDLLSLIGARALAAAGFALAFMSCQSLILAHTPADRRTRAAADFTSAYFLATLCGTVLGGLLAQELGNRPTLLLAGGVALAALLVAAFFMGALRDTVQPAPAATAGRPGALGELLGNRRYSALLLLGAVPNRLANVAVLFYLAPLALDALGFSKADIGRLVALYALAMAFATPPIARLVDRYRLNGTAVVAGGLLTGVGLLGVFLLPPAPAMILAIAAMGLGQAMSIPSQMGMVPSIAAASCQRLGLPTVMTVFRLGERLPSFAGPVLAGLLAGSMGYAGALGVMGAVVAGGSLLLAPLLHKDKKGSASE